MRELTEIRETRSDDIYREGSSKPERRSKIHSVSRAQTWLRPWSNTRGGRWSDDPQIGIIRSIERGSGYWLQSIMCMDMNKSDEN